MSGTYMYLCTVTETVELDLRSVQSDAVYRYCPCLLHTTWNYVWDSWGSNKNNNIKLTYIYDFIGH